MHRNAAGAVFHIVNPLAEFGDAGPLAAESYTGVAHAASDPGGSVPRCCVRRANGDDKKPEEIKGWGTVVDPAGDCKVTEKDGKMTITVPKTHHDLNPTSRFDNLLAPRVLQEVVGDFTVQVKVDAFARPEASTSSSEAGITFLAAGLLVWQDEKNFLRFLRAANGDRGDLFGHLEVYRDGKFVGHGYAMNIDDKTTHLKLTRKGDAFRFAVSADGKEWTEVSGQREGMAEIDLSKKVKVGVAAINATTKEFSPVFEGFTLMDMGHFDPGVRFSKTGVEAKDAISARLTDLSKRLACRNADLESLMDDKTRLRSFLIRDATNDYPYGGQMGHELPSKDHQQIIDLCKRINRIEKEMTRLSTIRENLKDDQQLELDYDELMELGFGPRDE